MLRHAGRAVPWPLVAAAAVLVVALLLAVRYDHWRLWPLQGVAVGLLAGAVGWCLDEPAAAVVDPAPRGLAWRTLARATGVLVLLSAWSAGTWLARDALYGHPWTVLLQGLAAALASVAWVTWCRARGEATPGQRWALTVVPLATAWALVRPFERQLPVFPYAFGGAYGDWTTSAAGWSVLGVAAAAVLVRTLAAD
ncbi:hypothetical protein ACIB24_08980 [Spongisporangium articulatum]|uniref:Uncharacterized protein n=1 Tax=Spongisporangium articulatum TaxID=3362603 RepID=A0ABW8ANL5_9ACTN